MAIPLDFADREALIRITTTSLSSKVRAFRTDAAACAHMFVQVVSQNSALLAPLCVDAVLHIGDLTSSSADLRNIKARAQQSHLHLHCVDLALPRSKSDELTFDQVVKKLGGTVDDTEGFEGLVFAQKVAKVAA